MKIKVKYSKHDKVWWVVCDGYCMTYAHTPKEAKRKARQWHMYMTAPTDEMADKYLTGEIHVK